MMNRKQMKKQGKHSLKKHYFIFVAACLIAAFLSAEFRSSLNFSSAQTYEQTYEQIENDVSGGGSYTVQTNMRSIGWEDVLRIIAEDDTQAGKEMAEQIKENAIEHADKGNPAFGRTRGVFSGIVNQVTSGSIIVTAVAAIASITGSENAGVMVLIVLGALFMFFFWFLIQNTFPVAVRRVFLEGLLYKRVTAQRFLFLLRIKKWLKASWTMFVKYVFYSLWCLTIAGIAVKHYSYYLVPYIVAENPDMTARQAITLSRRMMKGHKWECFVFELSFIGWEILGLLTMGVFNLFFTNPYKTAAFTQYYARLRAEAKEKKIPDAELLHDTYLYEKPEEQLLKEKYADVISVVENAPEEEDGLTGWRGFLARNFGVIFLRREEDREYERRQAEMVKVYELIDDTQGEAYPVRFYPIPEENRRKLVQSLNYMRHYSVWSLVVLFLGLSFFGWLWEVGMHLVSYGTFVNRGALHGPWLPIYGTGAVLILTLLYRLRRNPALEFTAAIVVCGFLEYMTSLVMEIATGGMKWWDYSGYFLNLNGRICAEGLLVFGIGGLAITYAIAPMADNLVSRFNEKRLKIVCIVLMAIFFADAVYSQIHPNAGKGVTDIKASFSSPHPEIEKNQDDNKHFSKAYIPLNARSGLENQDYTINKDGIPCCPHDPLLLMKPEGSKSNLRSGIPAFKFVCPKMKWVYDKAAQKSHRQCFCETPCTSSKCGRMVYIYPEKDLRAYPGTIRGTEEWDNTCKIRTVVERDINHIKDNLCLAGRRTQNEKTLHADLILSGITQLKTSHCIGLTNSIKPMAY